MRKVIIKYRKNKCLMIGNLKIYKSTKDGDIVINGIRCKKIGVLKKGKQLEFEIDNDKTILIASPSVGEFIDMFNSKLLILEGNEDVMVTGELTRELIRDCENEHFNGLNNFVFKFDEGIKDTQTIN